MTSVTIERKGINKKIMTLLNNGFTHSGQLDYFDNRLSLVSAASPYGVQMEVWTKQDGKKEDTRIEFGQLG